MVSNIRRHQAMIYARRGHAARYSWGYIGILVHQIQSHLPTTSMILVIRMLVNVGTVF